MRVIYARGKRKLTVKVDPEKKWTGEEIREVLFEGMAEGVAEGSYGKSASEDWFKVLHYAELFAVRKGVKPDLIRPAMSEIIFGNDPRFTELQVAARRRTAIHIATNAVAPVSYNSFETFFEAFRVKYIDGLKEGLDSGDSSLLEEAYFNEDLVVIKEGLKQVWDSVQERTLQARAVAEEIQYRHLERIERRRLKRLADEEEARKLAAEEETKRRSEEALREREARKAEARRKAEEAKERARARAEAKRAAWLAEHPRKHE